MLRNNASSARRHDEDWDTIAEETGDRSWRNASMGLRLAALRAGKKPKTTPTPAENRQGRVLRRHDAPGTRLNVARVRPGSNSNALADEQQVDALSGNAVLNGIPVEVAPG